MEVKRCTSIVGKGVPQKWDVHFLTSSQKFIKKPYFSRDTTNKTLSRYKNEVYLKSG
jgi:hypothetical protein